MKLKLLVSTLLSITTLTPALASTGEISGRQYVILGKGAEPIPDNTILYAPCAPINENCLSVKESLVSKLSSAVDVLAEAHQRTRSAGRERGYSSLPYHTVALEELRLFDVWIDTLKSAKAETGKLQRTGIAKTDFEGRFKFDCPTQNCFVYSQGQTAGTMNQWVEVLPAGKTTDLAASNSYGVNIPDSMQ